MARPEAGNDVIVSLRYPKAIRERLRKIAEKERRSLNAQMVIALEQWLSQHPDH